MYANTPSTPITGARKHASTQARKHANTPSMLARKQVNT